MSFLDHLEELRWHILRSLIAIITFSLVAFFNKKLIFHDLILGPSRADFITYRLFCKAGAYFKIDGLCIDVLNFTIQSRTMTGQFSTHLTVSLIAGFVVSFPYIFWEFWRFIKPGLYAKERNLTRGAVFFVSLLFLIGILFGYFVLSPLSINFLANYTVDDSIANQFDLLSYINILLMMVLACGAMFQLPMVVYVLSKIGIVTPVMMRKFRKHSFVIILIIAAILTPSPDVFSQMLVAIPLYGLYEISIYVSASIFRNKQRALALTPAVLEA